MFVRGRQAKGRQRHTLINSPRSSWPSPLTSKVLMICCASFRDKGLPPPERVFTILLEDTTNTASMLKDLASPLWKVFFLPKPLINTTSGLASRAHYLTSGSKSPYLRGERVGAAQ